MRVVQHASNNAVLAAPAGSTIDECRPAPITRLSYSDGTNSVKTYWQPSQAERCAIAAGLDITVEVLGQTMPPMIVSVDAIAGEAHES